MRVSDILKSKGGTLYTVAPDEPLANCVITMADQDLGSLVVMDGQKLVGVLTFREVIRVLADRHKALPNGPVPPVAEMPVSRVMNSTPVVASPDTELHDLRALMLDHHQRYLPVMEGPVLLGVISFHDVARTVFEEQSFENQMLKSYIRDWPSEGSSVSQGT